MSNNPKICLANDKRRCMKLTSRDHFVVIVIICHIYVNIKLIYYIHIKLINIIIKINVINK